MSDLGDIVFQQAGRCPVCGEAVTFVSDHKSYFRERLRCPVCAERYKGSLVRNRALFRAFELFGVDPAALHVHEIGPGYYGSSPRLREIAKRYTASKFWSDRPMGETFDGFVNLNAEDQFNFADASFDLVTHTDVYEHINHPDRAMGEIWRTLKPGGWHIFTAPTHGEFFKSRRVALIKDDGSTEHYEKPEYHGGPTGKALLVWRYGYDFPQLIRQWADFDVTVLRFEAPRIGAMGQMTETYVCQKPA